MNNFVQKVSKYVSDNPKFVLIVILVLVILVIWLYLKSKNIISSFSSKKNKLKKGKSSKINTDSDLEEEVDEPKTAKFGSQKKSTADPAVAQLVKDINQNS